MYLENQTLVFMQSLFDKIGFDRNSLTLVSEGEIADMIDGYVYDVVAKITKKVEDMKKPIDDQCLSLEKMNMEDNPEEQKKLDNLYDQQAILDKVLEHLDY